MILAGKCPPETRELAAARDRGFDAVELYLETQHLDRFAETVSTVRDADVEVASVHTPHIALDGLDYVKQADRLARTLDAYLVVHSQHLLHVHIPQIVARGLEAAHGFENNPGASLHHLTHTILDPGHDLVFDTAHFFLAHGADYDQFEHVLSRYGERIHVLHLNDANHIKDGYGFGDGVMDMERVSQLVADRFDGVLVFEVMPEDQIAARNAYEQFTQ